MAASEYTLASIDAAVLTRVEDNFTCFTQFERTAVINEAIRCVNILTGFYQGTLQLISVAGQLVYQVPTGMLYPQRVEFEGVQLDPIPITRIGQDHISWTTDTTIKYGPVARWVPIGQTYFCLNPIDSNGGGSISVSGVLSTPLLVNQTDSIVLPDEFANIIVEYCAQRLPLKIGGASATAASQLYTKSFQPSLKPLVNLSQFKFPKYWINNGSPTTEGKIQ
jgi:hypothetical protein